MPLLDAPSQTSRILIVDDSETDRMFLKHVLYNRGYRNLFLAKSAEQALQDFDALEPDLVILDLMMPGMNGFECCHSLRQLPEGKDLPILIQTALDQPQSRYQAFENGATDFISKPVLPEELCARITVHLDKRNCMRTLKEYKTRMQSQLSSARALQHDILPSKSDIAQIEAHYKLDIASHFEPSSEIGGDFWGMKRLMPHELAFWMVDFSGHGVASALNAFRLQAYLMEPSILASRPGEYLMLLNEKLVNLLLRGQFATMFYGVIDLNKEQLLFASAGSPYPFVTRGDTGDVEMLEVTGRPLGISLHTYWTQSIPFKRGDSVMFYTDALTETKNREGQFLDEATISSWLREPGGNASDIMQRLVQRFKQHAGVRNGDDLTLGYIRRRNE